MSVLELWCAKLKRNNLKLKNANLSLNVLNNKINKIKYPNVSMWHEYCNKFDGKSLIKIFYFIDCGNI